MLAAIDLSKDTFNIAVRIIDLWWVQSKEEFNHVEMLLMDGQGDRIHAVVKKEHVQAWAAQLEEGSTYYMHNFKIIANDSQYKVCAHPYKLVFTGATILKKVNLSDIPLKCYEFKSFEDIVNQEYDPDLLIDIIGIVEEAQLLLPEGNPPKVIFSLRDLSSVILSCTLWNDHAKKFIIWLEQRTGLDCMIVLLTQATIRSAEGVHGYMLSNTLYGSKLFINDEIRDFGIYKQRLTITNVDGHLAPARSSAKHQHYQRSRYSELEQFLYQSAAVRLSDISHVSDGTIFCIVGTTSKLIAAKTGWFYHSCTGCTKKTDAEHVPYTCSCGKFKQTSVARYRVQVVVSNEKKSANFFFFLDRDCTDIVGTTASSLRRIMIEAGEDDPKCFTEPLDKMLGLTLALKCKNQAKFNSSSVLRASRDPTIVKAIMDRSDCEKDGASGSSIPTIRGKEKMDLYPDHKRTNTYASEKPFFAKIRKGDDCSSSETSESDTDNHFSASISGYGDVQESSIQTPSKRLPSATATVAHISLRKMLRRLLSD